MLRAALTRWGWMPPRCRGATAGHNDARLREQRSKRGIYAGKDIRFGNNISLATESRTFKRQRGKRLWSGRSAAGCASTSRHALRCIDRAGGIDVYSRRRTKLVRSAPTRHMGSRAG